MSVSIICALEKKTQQLNIITENIDPSLGNAKYYVYRELNCNDVHLEWDYERVIENLRTSYSTYISRT